MAEPGLWSQATLTQSPRGHLLAVCFQASLLDAFIISSLFCSMCVMEALTSHLHPFRVTLTQWHGHPPLAPDKA